MYLRRKCPFCFSRMGFVTDDRENVAIDTEKGVYMCWRCKAAGALTPWVCRKLDIPESAFIAAAGPRNWAEDEDKPVKPRTVPKGYVPLFPWSEVKDSLVLRPYVRYLERRKVTPEALTEFRIGVILGVGRPGAIVFPVLDPGHVGWLVRNPRTGEKRNSKGLGRENALYNGRRLRGKGPVFVVEGPFDAVVLGNAVATMGVSVTEEQMERLAAYPGRIIVGLDGDAWMSGRVLANRLALRGHKDVHWIHLPSGRDPADLGQEFVEGLALTAC